ncbi:MAG: type II secretion system protein [Patescibacteria group bacterium]|nr:type II secretion system protein [Patescibacteria group bacterium]
MKILQKGQTLIEVLVALSVITLIVTSITIAVVTSLNNAEFVKNQNLATQYAQQGMEMMRFMRNTNYGEFVGLSQHYCLADTCRQVETDSTAPDYATCGPNPGVCNPNVNNTFVREITVYNNPPGAGSPNQCQFGTYVISSVSWADNKCTSRSNPYCHSVNISSCFSSGDVISAPN